MKAGTMNIFLVYMRSLKALVPATRSHSVWISCAATAACCGIGFCSCVRLRAGARLRVSGKDSTLGLRTGLLTAGPPSFWEFHKAQRLAHCAGRETNHAVMGITYACER